MTPEREAARRERALALRNAKYAVKFIIDRSPGRYAPTDENLSHVLARCVLPPRPEMYPAIRFEVESYQADQFAWENRNLAIHLSLRDRDVEPRESHTITGYARIGIARSTGHGGTSQYGVYGVRGNGTQVFSVYEGRRDPGGPFEHADPCYQKPEWRPLYPTFTEVNLEIQRAEDRETA